MPSTSMGSMVSFCFLARRPLPRPAFLAPSLGSPGRPASEQPRHELFDRLAAADGLRDFLGEHLRHPRRHVRLRLEPEILLLDEFVIVEIVDRIDGFTSLPAAPGALAGATDEIVISGTRAAFAGRLSCRLLLPEHLARLIEVERDVIEREEAANELDGFLGERRVLLLAGQHRCGFCTDHAAL